MPFDRDFQMLRYLYFNEGYVQVKIDRPQVYVTPDKKNIYITIRIDEGEQFDVGDIDFAGDILFPRDELGEAIAINKRKVFSYEVLQKDLSDLQAKYGDLGYAFANVIPRPVSTKKSARLMSPSNLIRATRFTLARSIWWGNSKTRDKGDPSWIENQRGRAVQRNPPPPIFRSDSAVGIFWWSEFQDFDAAGKNPISSNIDIVVKERNTGSIQLGAGYGNGDRIYFGRGKWIRATF